MNPHCSEDAPVPSGLRSAEEIDVSVVVPAFDAESVIRSTIQSILLQKDVSIEVIVVDDCSTDRTKEIVLEIGNSDPRVRYIRTSTNSRGPATPRNLGVLNSVGRWIAFCDADDLWHPSKLEIQVRTGVRYDADLICSAMSDFKNGSPVPMFLTTPIPQVKISRVEYWMNFLKNRIATSSVICRRDHLVSQRFETSSDLIAVEDFDLWLRLLENREFKALRIDNPLVAYRRQSTSLSSQKWRQALKALRVQRRASARRGWNQVFPVVVPILIVVNGALSVYWRVIRRML
jgi:teichuronic acid biosynthesis glycosyltransferase TuaG